MDLGSYIQRAPAIESWALLVRSNQAGPILSGTLPDTGDEVQFGSLDFFSLRGGFFVSGAWIFALGHGVQPVEAVTSFLRNSNLQPPPEAWVPRDAVIAAGDPGYDRPRILRRALAAAGSTRVYGKADAANANAPESSHSKVPEIHDWRYVRDRKSIGRLCGLVTNHPEIPDGEPIRSSRVLEINVAEGWARTRSRLYYLGVPSVRVVTA